MDVSDATSSSYHPKPTIGFGGGGSVTVQIWRFRFEAVDAIYEIAEARVVLTPPPWNDIEDVSFSLESPTVGADCKLQEYQPPEDAAGWSLGGSLGLGHDGSITGDATLDVPFASEAPEVTSAGGDAYENANWKVDFPDWRDASTKRATLDFFAMWRCPKDTDMLPITFQGYGLTFEIDSWGTDERYGVHEDGFWEQASVPDDPPALNESEEFAAFMDTVDVLALPAQGTYWTRVRAYGVPGLIEDIEGEAHNGTNPVALEAATSGVAGNLSFVEYAARVQASLGAWNVTPTATLTPVGFDPVTIMGAPIAIVQPLSEGLVSVPLVPGRRVYGLEGEAGTPFQLRVSGASDARAVRLMDDLGDDAHVETVGDGVTHGVFARNGPFLLVDVVTGAPGFVEVELSTDSDGSQTASSSRAAAPGLHVLGVLAALVVWAAARRVR